MFEKRLDKIQFNRKVPACGLNSTAVKREEDSTELYARNVDTLKNIITNYISIEVVAGDANI